MPIGRWLAPVASIALYAVMGVGESLIGRKLQVDVPGWSVRLRRVGSPEEIDQVLTSVPYVTVAEAATSPQ
jgi:hypothetical protein